MRSPTGSPSASISGELVGLAAEPDDQHAGEIGMARIARPSCGAADRWPSPSLPAAQPYLCVSATTPSILAKSPSPCRSHLLGDHARDRRRAVHRRQHADIVARRDAAVRPNDPVEGRGLVLRDFRKIGTPAADGVIAGRRLKGEIVRVYVLAGRDLACSDADHLSEFEHGLVFPDRRYGEFVALRNGPLNQHRSNANRLAWSELAEGHNHRIGRMQPDDGGAWITHLRHYSTDRGSGMPNRLAQGSNVSRISGRKLNPCARACARSASDRSPGSRTPLIPGRGGLLRQASAIEFGLVAKGFGSGESSGIQRLDEHPGTPTSRTVGPAMTGKTLAQSFDGEGQPISLMAMVEPACGKQRTGRIGGHRSGIVSRLAFGVDRPGSRKAVALDDGAFVSWHWW